MRHRHNFVTIHSNAIRYAYVKKPPFGKPINFIKDCLARLQRCECGEEMAEIVEQPEKFYIDRRDVPEGVGKIDPAYYKQKFMPETSKCSKCPFGSTLKEYEEDDTLAGEQHEDITK